jgi:hypothetical protein
LAAPIPSPRPIRPAGDDERKIVSDFDLAKKDIERVAGFHSQAGKDFFGPPQTRGD